MRVRHNSLQRATTHCNTRQHTATHSNTWQHTATHGSTPAKAGGRVTEQSASRDTCMCDMTHCNTLYRIATHPPHTATHCNTLQHTATHCNTLQHTATHCNTLQHTATHCNTLQHTATHLQKPVAGSRNKAPPEESPAKLAFTALDEPLSDVTSFEISSKPFGCSACTSSHGAGHDRVEDMTPSTYMSSFGWTCHVMWKTRLRQHI